MHTGLAPAGDARTGSPVHFGGMATGGFLGGMTEVWDLHCCDGCHEARAVLPGHQRIGCTYNAAAAAAVDAGLAEAMYRDGEWQLVLTDVGRAAFAERSGRRHKQRLSVERTKKSHQRQCA